MNARPMMVAAVLVIGGLGLAILPPLLGNRDAAYRRDAAMPLLPAAAATQIVESPNSLFTGSIVPRSVAVRADDARGLGAGDAEWPFFPRPAAGLYTPQQSGD